MPMAVPFTCDPEAAARWVRRKYAVGLTDRACQVAARMGLRVEYVSLPQHRAGYLLPHPAGGYVVLLNRAHSPQRQNWTCAHELGHYILHRYMRRSGSLHRPPARFEREADAFAAALLMPADSVRILAQVYDARQMALALGVSRQAALQRILELGARTPYLLGKGGRRS
jgi:Zn-dependent peptidase ImmA (M78 family)